MIYLIAAILGSSFLTIILKMFQLKGVNTSVGIAVNYIVGAALAFLFAPELMSVGEIARCTWFWMSVITGIMFMISFVIYALSAQLSGVAVTAVSGRAAMAIPVIFAFAVLGEQPTWLKVSMLVLILLALPLIIYKKRDATQSRVSLWVVLLPVVVFLFNGTNDTMVQFTQKTMVPDAVQIPILMGTMFAAGAVAGVIWYFIDWRSKRVAPTGRDLLWGTILGATNWVCMFGVFNALNVMDGSLFFPFYYTGAIVIATIAGVWAFKEKLSALNYLGVALAILAIIVLAGA